MVRATDKPNLEGGDTTTKHHNEQYVTPSKRMARFA